MTWNKLMIKVIFYNKNDRAKQTDINLKSCEKVW